MSRRASLLLAALCLLPGRPGSAQTSERLYLSGVDKDKTVSWEFQVSAGRKAGAWSRIPVPSNWELHGFGTYKYGGPAPRPAEQGRYKHQFDLPASWRDRRVFLVFEGSMTDTEAWIDGRSVGPKHQGGFTEFRYDVTPLLRTGKRFELEVLVSKESSDASVNEAERNADFWIFGGIYRPVYLEAHPPEFVERVAIDARHDGAIKADVHLRGITSRSVVSARVETLDGQPVAPPFTAPVDQGNNVVSLEARIDRVRPWTAESPNLYRLVVQLVRGGFDAHVVIQPFGFRTVELRPRDGLYVNGTKVRLKGVNRHSFWPDSGRATSREVSEMDVRLIKDMNMNAVRMSHYPPDRHFLDLCDELGLYVLDELTGWQHRYDTAVGRKLVRELVTRDLNHPSVILWDNGNEGGFNEELVPDFHAHDPQKRPVIHPWKNEAGKLNSTHYRAFGCCAGKYLEGPELVMPTEVLHGLYDGGHGAGLSDLWNRMLQNPLAVGAFLWSLADEGIVRTDRNGELDTDGNHAPDGIVGPRREKEASFYAIREIWSPVYIELSRLDRLPPSFGGRLRVENRYDFTDLSQVAFEWRLVNFTAPGAATPGAADVAKGATRMQGVAPGDRGTLDLELPKDWRNADALYLVARGPAGREIHTWTWMIQSPEQVRARIVSAGARADGGRPQAAGAVVIPASLDAAGPAISVRPLTGGPEPASAETGSVTIGQTDTEMVLITSGTRVGIAKATGLLAWVEQDGRMLTFKNGPRLVAGETKLASIKHAKDADGYAIEAVYEGGMSSVRWRLAASGWLELAYRYVLPGRHANLGVSFDLPEAQVSGLTWLGRGPYRVWKNRMAGAGFGVWRKAKNDTRTGVEWVYPEFKGHHADFYWAVLETKDGPITAVTDTEDLFLRVLTPRPGPNPTFTEVAFPEGDISFLHAIPPIGNKFAGPETTGPEGQPNETVGENPTQNMGAYAARLFFRFGAKP